MMMMMMMIIAGWNCPHRLTTFSGRALFGVTGIMRRWTPLFPSFFGCLITALL